MATPSKKSSLRAASAIGRSSWALKQNQARSSFIRVLNLPKGAQSQKVFLPFIVDTKTSTKLHFDGGNLMSGQSEFVQTQKLN